MKKIEITGKPARKINVIGKTMRRIDPKEVAAALGAEPEPIATLDNPDLIDLAEIGSKIIKGSRK